MINGHHGSCLHRQYISTKHIRAIAVGSSVRMGGHGELITSLKVVTGLFLMCSLHATHLVFEKHATAAPQMDG